MPPERQAVPGPPPAARIQQLSSGYQISRALYLIAQFGIADLLKDGPKSADALATARQINADALYRVMRALASLGVFAEIGPREFALTPVSETLRSDVPGSLRALVLLQVDDRHWDVYKELGHSLRTGEPAFDHVFRQRLTDYLRQHPEELQKADRAMAAFSAGSGAAIAEAYDFSVFRTIMDVGGGNGTLLSFILKRHVGPRGILFDLAQTIEHARHDALLPADRSELVVGDFFETVPAGADAYVLKNVIHDWQDDRARRILQNCRRAMTNAGKLLLVELLIPPDSSPDFSKFLDIEMLVTAGGRERTENEFRQLLASAGFRLDGVRRTQSPLWILEASPV